MKELEELLNKTQFVQVGERVGNRIKKNVILVTRGK